MKKLLLSILALCLLLVACNSTASSDSSDLESVQTERAERVVTLTSLTADIVERLDSTKLVGISGSRLLNEDPRFAGLPMVSTGRSAPNLEEIVALEPGLVIGADGFSDQTLSKLEELGIKTLSTNIDSWQALKDVIVSLAEAIAADPQPLLEQIQTYLPSNVNSEASTLLLVSRQPILSPNKNSWAGDLLDQFRAQNLAADLQGNSQFGGYVTLSAEKILQSDPEVILLVDPGQEGVEEQFKAEPFWKELKASQSGNIYTFDYFGLVNPGSLDKIQEACEQLAQIFVR